MPVLEDGDFRLTECSAILKYLADKVGSPAYPKDLQKRARVNELMDWLNTGFYRDFGYGPSIRRSFRTTSGRSDEAQAATLEWGKEKTQVLARGPRREPARPGKRVPVRRRDHDRRLPRRGMISAGEADRLRLRRISQPRALVRQHEGAAELGKVNEAFYGCRRLAEGQGVRRV